MPIISHFEACVFDLVSIPSLIVQHIHISSAPYVKKRRVGCQLCEESCPQKPDFSYRYSSRKSPQ